jgi:acetyl esterase
MKSLLKNRVVLVLLLALVGFGIWTYSWTFTEHGRLDYRAALSLHLLTFERKFKPRPDGDFELDMPVNLAFGLSMLMPRDDVSRVEDRTIAGPESALPIRIYWPPAGVGDGVATPPPPVLLYFHGGGFVVGDLDIFDPLARSLCKYTRSIVISVDYRLAPEHPYPAAVNDAYAALLWAADNARALGGDPDRLIVAGDSAGGTLATITALKARDEHGPAIAYQLLYYPGVDFVTTYPSTENFGENYGLPAKAVRAMRSAYMGRAPDPRHPYLSPLFAYNHRDLPPALIVTAGFDPLTDAGHAYVEKLRQAGVTVTHAHYPGMIHGFMGIVFFDQQRDALEKTGQAISDGLRRPPPS